MQPYMKYLKEMAMVLSKTQVSDSWLTSWPTCLRFRKSVLYFIIVFVYFQMGTMLCECFVRLHGDMYHVFWIALPDNTHFAESHFTRASLCFKVWTNKILSLFCR